MLLCSLIGQFVLLLGALVLAAQRTIRAKGYWTGILSGALVLYGLFFGSSFLFSVVIPSVLLALGADKHAVVESFPEAIGNVPVVLLGWLPALLFAVIVRRVHEARQSAPNTARPDADGTPGDQG
jgi:hypothetical protein